MNTPLQHPQQAPAFSAAYVDTVKIPPNYSLWVAAERTKSHTKFPGILPSTFPPKGAKRSAAPRNQQPSAVPRPPFPQKPPPAQGRPSRRSPSRPARPREARGGRGRGPCAAGPFPAGPAPLTAQHVFLREHRRPCTAGPPGGAAATAAEVTARLQRAAPRPPPPNRARRAPRPRRRGRGRARPLSRAARMGRGRGGGMGSGSPGRRCPHAAPGLTGNNRPQHAAAAMSPASSPLPSNMAPPRPRSCRRADFVTKPAALGQRGALPRPSAPLSPAPGRREPAPHRPLSHAAKERGPKGGRKRRARRPRPSANKSPRGGARDALAARGAAPLPGAPRPLPRGAAEHKAPPPGTPREAPPRPLPAASTSRVTAAAVPELGVGGERSPRAAAASAPCAALFWRHQLPPAPRRARHKLSRPGLGPPGHGPRPHPPRPLPLCRAARPGVGRSPFRARAAAGGKEGRGERGRRGSPQRREARTLFRSPSFRPLPPRVRAREAPPPPRLPCALLPLSPAAHPLTHTPSRRPGHSQRPARPHPRAAAALPPAPHRHGSPGGHARAAVTLTRRRPPPSSLRPAPAPRAAAATGRGAERRRSRRGPWGWWGGEAAWRRRVPAAAAAGFGDHVGE